MPLQSLTPPEWGRKTTQATRSHGLRQRRISRTLVMVVAVAWAQDWRKQAIPVVCIGQGDRRAFSQPSGAPGRISTWSSVSVSSANTDRRRAGRVHLAFYRACQINTTLLPPAHPSGDAIAPRSALCAGRHDQRAALRYHRAMLDDAADDAPAFDRRPLSASTATISGRAKCSVSSRCHGIARRI